MMSILVGLAFLAILIVWGKMELALMLSKNAEIDFYLTQNYWQKFQLSVVRCLVVGVTLSLATAMFWLP
jgi:hypothetical protein